MLVSPIVWPAFRASLSRVRAPRPTGSAWCLNPHVEQTEAPRVHGVAEGSVLLVRDPVRSLTLPYWTSSRDLSHVSGLSTIARARWSARTAALVGAGIVHEAEATRLARRRFERGLARAREAIETCGYAVLWDLLPAGFVDAVRRHFRARIAAGQLALGDPQVSRRYSAYDEPVCAWLHTLLTPLVARAIPHAIARSYAFLSAYVGGASLARHTDRPACEYTLSLTIDATPDASHAAAWPLCLESDADEAVVKVLLAPGDALLFRGRRLPHYRDPLPKGCTSTSLLFHFVHAHARGLR